MLRATRGQSRAGCRPHCKEPTICPQPAATGQVSTCCCVDNHKLNGSQSEQANTEQTALAEKVKFKRPVSLMAVQDCFGKVSTAP